MKALTITINPCIDKSTTVNGIAPEHKLRCNPPKYEPGGGGVNVSRALKKLKVNAPALFASGGRTGKLLESLLQDEGLQILPFAINSETRENFIVVDTTTNEQFRFGFPGEALTKSEQTALLNTIDAIKDFPELSIISGSLPEGVNADFIKEIIQLCKSKNSKVVVDTSGKSLEAAVEEGVYLLKPNIGELATLAGKDELTALSMEESAKKLLNNGSAELIVVSHGATGATLFSKNETIHQEAPIVKVRSTVGAGDSMVAGMVYALINNHSMKETLRMGVACGSATTMASGTGLFKTEHVFEILQELKSN